MIWLLCTLALADEPLSAEDEERAKQLFTHGQELYDQARFDEAAAAFELAYSLSKKPLLLYNMASALERLGRWEQALEAMVKYREDAPPEELETLDRRVASLQEKVDAEREKQAALEAARNPPPPQPVEPPPKRGPKAGAIALFGIGAVGLGTGAAFTARTLSARSAWTSQCVDGLCPSGASDLVKRDKVSSLLADVSWIVGLGAVGGGVAVSLGGGGQATDLVVGIQGAW